MCVGASPSSNSASSTRKQRLSYKKVLKLYYFCSDLRKGGIPEQQKRNKRRSAQGTYIKYKLF
jgi:hypothetical protein